MSAPYIKHKRKFTLRHTSKFYKLMAVPDLMYGNENWSLNRSDKRKIEAAEMRFDINFGTKKEKSADIRTH